MQLCGATERSRVSEAGPGGQAPKKHGFYEPVYASLCVSKDLSADGCGGFRMLWMGVLNEILLSPQPTSVPIIHTFALHATQRGIYREPGSPFTVGQAPSCVVARAM